MDQLHGFVKTYRLSHISQIISAGSKPAGAAGMAANRLLWRAARAVSGAGVATGMACTWCATSANPAVCKASTATKSKEPGMELLVHNVSHADMVLSLREHGPQSVNEEQMPSFLAKPLFNTFMPISELVVGQLDRLQANGSQPQVLSCMSTYRVQYPLGLDLTGETAGLLMEASTTEPSTSPSRQFHIHKSRKELELHRKVEGKRPLSSLESGVRVVAAYLPLIAVVIPEWIRSIKRRNLHQPASHEPRKVLVLVSGAGQPRDERANPADNSTEGVGRIIERFMQIVYPDIEVVHIHSAFGIFRYDDNVCRHGEQRPWPALAHAHAGARAPCPRYASSRSKCSL